MWTGKTIQFLMCQRRFFGKEDKDCGRLVLVSFTMWESKERWPDFFVILSELF